MIYSIIIYRYKVNIVPLNKIKKRKGTTVDYQKRSADFMLWCALRPCASPFLRPCLSGRQSMFFMQQAPESSSQRLASSQTSDGLFLPRHLLFSGTHAQIVLFFWNAGEPTSHSLHDNTAIFPSLNFMETSSERHSSFKCRT